MRGRAKPTKIPLLKPMPQRKARSGGFNLRAGGRPLVSGGGGDSESLTLGGDPVTINDQNITL